MKVKYIVMFVMNGVTKQIDYSKEQKMEAVAAFKNIKLRADRTKFFSIDSDDNDIWYDLSNNY